MKKGVTALTVMLAGGAMALADTPDARRAGPVQAGVKHMYINLATGERRISDTAVRYGDPIWESSDWGCYDGGLYYNGAHGGAVDGWGSEYVDWGSIANDTVINGFQFWYYTPDFLSDPDLGGVPGMNAHFWFYIDYYGWGDTFAMPVQEVVLYDLPGDPSYSWIITVDLEGGNEVTLSSTYDQFCGDDLVEWAWGMSWDMPDGGDPYGGYIGPIISTPPYLGYCNEVDTGCTGTATGVVDAWDIYYSAPMTDYFGTYWWGGWPDSLAASYYFVAYGPGGWDCPPDFNGDGVLNSQDFVAFLNAFVAGDPGADYNGDGVVNSQDFVAFLNDFVAGC